MANESRVHVKAEKEREIRTPADDPTYNERVRKGRQRIANGGLKFANNGDRLDYERRVASNPHNVPGLPAFFPPVTLKQMPVVHAAKLCKTEGCGGCCIAADYYICPKCGEDNRYE